MANTTRAAFIKVCTRDGMTEEAARSIIRSSATINRLGQDACNRKLSQRELNRSKNAENRVRGICDLFPGFTPDFSGDPRGHVVLIYVPSKEYNNAGGEGMAVPHGSQR